MLSRHKILAAALLFALAVNVAPAHAEAVHVGDAEQSIKTNPKSDQAAELRAKSDPAAKCGDVRSQQNVVTRPDDLPAQEKQPDAQSVSQQASLKEDCSGKSVEQVELCDVTGTVCEDCGEVVLGGGVLPEFAMVGVPGGFSISPLFSLVALPLGLLPILRRSGDNELTNALPLVPGTVPGPPTVVVVPPEPPLVPVPPTPVPEPISLLLFGSGLSAVAAAMRRRKKSQLADSQAIDAAVEG